MPEYRRVYVPGGTCFFTIVTYQRSKIFHDPQACELLRVTWSTVAKNLPFTADAFCLLPDYFNCVVSLPENDMNFSMHHTINKVRRPGSLITELLLH